MDLLNNKDGVILIYVLILLAIIALLGIIVINTSTVDIQISGYSRTATMAFEGAEAGVDLAIPVIENTIENGLLTPAAAAGLISGLDAAGLGSEVLGGRDNDTDTASASPDISIADLGGGVGVNVDIDRLYTTQISGGAQQFATGYEGTGSGAAGGGVGILYRIESQGTR